MIVEVNVCGPVGSGKSAIVTLPSGEVFTKLLDTRGFRYRRGAQA